MAFFVSISNFSTKLIFIICFTIFGLHTGNIYAEHMCNAINGPYYCPGPYDSSDKSLCCNTGCCSYDYFSNEIQVLPTPAAKSIARSVGRLIAILIGAFIVCVVGLCICCCCCPCCLLAKRRERGSVISTPGGQGVAVIPVHPTVPLSHAPANTQVPNPVPYGNVATSIQNQPTYVHPANQPQYQAGQFSRPMNAPPPYPGPPLVNEYNSSLPLVNPASTMAPYASQPYHKQPAYNPSVQSLNE